MFVGTGLAVVGTVGPITLIVRSVRTFDPHDIAGAVIVALISGLLMGDILSIYFDSGRRTLHDRMSGTVVIRVK
jgi:uncharacterized RDD family membrane protein YckC